MKEIDWKEVAEKYDLSPEEIQEQILITACVMADIIIEKHKQYQAPKEFQFTCSQRDYQLELAVKRKELQNTEN